MVNFQLEKRAMLAKMSNEAINSQEDTKYNTRLEMKHKIQNCANYHKRFRNASMSVQKIIKREGKCLLGEPHYADFPICNTLKNHL